MRLLESCLTTIPKGPRAQIDRKLYKRHMQNTLFHYPNLEARAGSVFDLVFNKPLSETFPEHSPNPHELPRISGVQLGAYILLLSIYSSTQYVLSHRLWGIHWLLASCYLHWYIPLWRDSHRFVPIRSSRPHSIPYTHS